MNPHELAARLRKQANVVAGGDLHSREVIEAMREAANLLVGARAEWRIYMKGHSEPEYTVFRNTPEFDWAREHGHRYERRFVIQTPWEPVEADDAGA